MGQLREGHYSASRWLLPAMGIVLVLQSTERGGGSSGSHGEGPGAGWQYPTILLRIIMANRSPTQKRRSIEEVMR